MNQVNALKINTIQKLASEGNDES